MFGFDIFVEVAQIFSKRVDYLEANDNNNSLDYEVEECEQMLNNLFNSLLTYKTRHPDCTLRLNTIYGILVNHFQVSSLYESYHKLK